MSKEKSKRLPGPYSVRVSLSRTEAQTIARLLNMALLDDTERGLHHIQESAREALVLAGQRAGEREQARRESERKRHEDLARNQAAQCDVKL